MLAMWFFTRAAVTVGGLLMLRDLMCEHVAFHIIEGSFAAHQVLIRLHGCLAGLRRLVLRHLCLGRRLRGTE